MTAPTFSLPMTERDLDEEQMRRLVGNGAKTWAKVAAPQPAAPQAADDPFAIGQRVEKYTGEALWDGIIVASYLTTKGKRRYVVEVQPQGFQMIAVPSQLRAAIRAAMKGVDAA